MNIIRVVISFSPYIHFNKHYYCIEKNITVRERRVYIKNMDIRGFMERYDLR